MVIGGEEVASWIDITSCASWDRGETATLKPCPQEPFHGAENTLSSYTGSPICHKEVI